MGFVGTSWSLNLVRKLPVLVPHRQVRTDPVVLHLVVEAARAGARAFCPTCSICSLVTAEDPLRLAVDQVVVEVVPAPLVPIKATNRLPTRLDQVSHRRRHNANRTITISLEDGQTK